ncbi:putative FKBP-type peptidyl-prolyl cis-trans isomerase [bacterium BMS3Bbin04]|nr:putative FKBP-type peptidyl-prolyl cis-trans isomerase [bacterium BMS3Bbin04]
MRSSIAIVLLLAGTMLVACAQDKPETAAEGVSHDGEQVKVSDQGEAMADDIFTMPNLDELEWVDGPEGMKYTVLKEGIGTDIKAGDQASVHYIGWLKDNGNLFDSSRQRGNPFVFPVGAGRVIRGWDIGVDMMKVGGHWIFILPPELAYGQRGAGGDIPPGATLVFDVEVLGIQ